MRTAAGVVALLLLSGCVGWPQDLVHRIRLTPEVTGLENDAYYADPADSTTVFERQGFRLKVRYLSDAQLNQEFAGQTFREPNLNPFTYGTDRDLNRGYTPPRFAVFEVTIVNQAYPKVLVDPALMTLQTDRGGTYEWWAAEREGGVNNFETYYGQRKGEGGNEQYYYQERLGITRQALFRRHTFVFQGDTYTGKVVFAPLHPEVRRAVLRVEGIVLRVDAYDRPKETVDAVFPFEVRQTVVRVGEGGDEGDRGP